MACIEEIVVEGRKFTALTFPTKHTTMLLVQGCRLMVGCGYFSMATAERLGDALALVRGVSCIDDVLAAKIIELSPAAAALGIQVGQTAQEALCQSEQ